MSHAVMYGRLVKDRLVLTETHILRDNAQSYFVMPVLLKNNCLNECIYTQGKFEAVLKSLTKSQND